MIDIIRQSMQIYIRNRQRFEKEIKNQGGIFFRPDPIVKPDKSFVNIFYTHESLSQPIKLYPARIPLSIGRIIRESPSPLFMDSPFAQD